MTTAAWDLSRQTQRKISRRLLPFLFLIYITSYIDRVNVSFAGLQMTRDLNFSNEVFGFGAGIFFLGYSLLEIPGAMLAERWSARKWITAVMLVWGVLATLTGFIHTAPEFFSVRFVLGLAEGGFFPAVIVYLTHWFRLEQRAKAVAMFMAAIPMANSAGAPIAGRLLEIQWLGWHGWRWLLILEGIPAILGGIAAWFYLTDRPKQAHWLAPEERQWIVDEIERESADTRATHGSIFQTLRQPVVLLLTLCYFLMSATGYGLVLWLPKMVQKFSHLSTIEISLVAAIPNFCAIPAMLLIGWHSDRTGERRWHAALSCFAAAAGFAGSQAVAIPAVIVACLSLASMGIMGFYPPFWSLPSRFLSALGRGKYGIHQYAGEPRRICRTVSNWISDGSNRQLCRGDVRSGCRGGALRSGSHPVAGRASHASIGILVTVGNPGRQLRAKDLFFGHQ